MPKITEVVRSFSKTIQEEAYSPISLFASYKGELDGTETPGEIRAFSDRLFILAEQDVRQEQSRQETTKKREKELGGEAPF